jgi:hypothetical protein
MSSNLLDSFPVLRPISNPGELEALQVAAAGDGHLVIAPTFLVEKGGEICGYIGLNSLPLWQGWLHTQRMGPRDSASIFSQVDNVCRLQGQKHLALLLPDTSGFNGVVERFGYSKMGGPRTLYFKPL